MNESFSPDDFALSGFLNGLRKAHGWHGELDLPLPYAEIFRNDTTSTGIYQLAAGQADPQSPHEEDEVYFVLSGVGALMVAESRIDVGPGTWAFVPAHVEHRFIDITENLIVLVIFSPPHPPTGG